jgi:hypothetical protein
MPNPVRPGAWTPLALAAFLTAALAAQPASGDGKTDKSRTRHARPAETAEPADKAASAETTEPADAAPAEAQKPSQPVTLMGMQAYVDPRTGKLRQPTREEAQALRDEIAALTNRSVEGLQPVFHPDGTIGLDLQGRFLNLTVAHIDADGKLSMECLTGPPPAPAAATAAKRASPPARPRARPEVLDER